MHICLYSETALPKLGGQQIVVDRLARELSLLGHRVTLLTQPPRKPLVADDAALPYRVVRHPRFLSTTHLVSWYKRYPLRLHRHDPFDLLHCHSLYPTAWIASLAKEQLNVPLLLTSHGGDVREGGLRLRKPRLHARYVAAVRAADSLIAISRFTHDGYLRFDPAADPRITDIPNGVDLPRFAHPAPPPPDLPTPLPPHRYLHYIGRLTRQKGVDTLLQALSLLPPDLAPPLVITGDGPYMSVLRSLSQSLRLSNVHFVGRQSGQMATHLLQNALCTIVPSREYEAFGLVVLESHAAARPVIASDLPGLADLISPNQTGLLVPPENPQALATAIQHLLQNPAAATQMGHAGQLAAQPYAWPQIARRHADLYARLLTRPPATA